MIFFPNIYSGSITCKHSIKHFKKKDAIKTATFLGEHIVTKVIPTGQTMAAVKSGN